MRLTRFILLTALISFVILPSACQEEQTTAAQSKQIEPQKQAVEALKDAEPLKTEAPKQAVTPKKADAPIIKVENPVYDFGVMGPSQKKSGEFKFKNVGKATLNIKKIKSTCGCTVPELEKKDYAPGESGTIKVTYRSSTREAPVTKHLYIESNDSVKPNYELTIKAKVRLEIEVDPKTLELSLRKENAGAGPVTVTSKDGKPFAIKNFASSKNVITAEFDPTVESNKFVIQPKVDMELLKDQLKGSIRLDVTHPFSSQIDIPFEAKQPFQLSSPRFIFQNVLPGKYETKDVWIMSNYGDKVEIESTSSVKNLMDVIGQDQKENNIKLTIRVNPPQKKENQRSFSDTMKIKLKSGEELTIRCSGFYKRETK